MTPTVAVEETAIPGLLVVRLDVRTDDRGWFEEAWQREKMSGLGLPDFGPVQANLAWNAARGTTRGIHAEPWDKLVTIASGRAFGAWVDLRDGDTFGAVVTQELEPGVAVFVPRGVGNSYQTLADATLYAYLVNDHWRADASYAAVDLGDASLGIPWPIALADSVVSEKDRATPPLADVTPFPARRPLILGASGQLGRALGAAFPGARSVGRDELDIADTDALEDWPWTEHDLVLNAAAFTAVDAAETTEGRRSAWAVNAAAPAHLARIAARDQLLLVHYSTDYVFDGVAQLHDEKEQVAPLGAYGQSKAAGDLAVSTLRRHYLIRTSWVVGDGHNFVRTMQRLAADGASPSVVDDQVGRLTFADELARATRHLVDSHAPYGTYQVSNGGDPVSCADLARVVFALSGRDPEDVRRVSTTEYAAGRDLAPRPARSVLDLSALEATGFEPTDQLAALRAYCAGVPARP